MCIKKTMTTLWIIFNILLSEDNIIKKTLK